MKVLITGGAGFIGSSAALRFMSEGHQVIIVDNLSRSGAVHNLRWLQNSGKFTFVEGDVRNSDVLKDVFKAHKDLDAVYHLAAQVAVTTSVAEPRGDFEINAFGSFNVLEAARQYTPEAVLVYASTNKVYGGMEHLQVSELGDRYQYTTLPGGVSEDSPLDLHSPYGCSKGAADQYFRDYSRIYGLRTVVLRQSCIYGYRQFGVEDQGWVAWFTIAAALGKPITIFGDGKQVRDLLFIDDLIDVYQVVLKDIDVASGNIYNVGGGPQNQASLLDVLALLGELLHKDIPRDFSAWRPGDQRVCVLDISKARRDFDWCPRVGVKDGVARLAEWVGQNHCLFDV